MNFGIKNKTHKRYSDTKTRIFVERQTTVLCSICETKVARDLADVIYISDSDGEPVETIICKDCNSWRKKELGGWG